MEKISIIVPIYRVEQYLEQCIQSIRNQTYQNIEIILVDDGSDDRCPQICDHHDNLRDEQHSVWLACQLSVFDQTEIDAIIHVIICF